MHKNYEWTIDSIYKQLIEKLTKENRIRDVSSQLLGIDGLDERVLYVYYLLKNYEILPEIINLEKCDYGSTHYRNRGNHLFKQFQLYGAWQYYNMAMCYAHPLSENYGLALANRTAVFAALKKYKECLVDIEKVFVSKYPAHIRDKLLKRKSLCEEALAKGEESETENLPEFLKLKEPRHSQYLSASAKLSVKYSEEMGRHVVANDDIEVGEVIVQDDPYTRLLLKSQFYFACANCFSRTLNLYPCENCCLTMYCSEECSRQALLEYHTYECPMIASLTKMDFTKLELLALRIVIKAKTVCHANWPDLFKMSADAEAKLNTCDWGHVESGGKLVFDSKRYPAVHTLATNIEKRDISDIFQKSVSAAVLLHCLAVVNFLKSDNLIMKEKVKSFVAGLLLRHLMTAPTNMHGITTNVENDDGHYVEEYNIGSAPYAFLSLINHSCTPNVVRFEKLGSAQMNLVALRPIKKGMQLFDNYGAHHAVHTKQERQAILKFQYKFTCICEACVDNWPLYPNLVSPNLPANIVIKRNLCLNENVIEALQKADKDVAFKMYKPLCELAMALDPYIPCKEAAECQEALKQCIAIIAGVLPKGYKDYPDWHVPPPPLPGQPSTVRLLNSDGIDL